MNLIKTNPQILLDNIHLYLGNTHALRGITWKMEAGENWAILGKNGAGKSALLKLLSGDIYPQVKRGSKFLFAGHDRFKPGFGLWDIRKHIGVVSPEFQSQYREETTGLEVILSGFYGSNGLYKKVTSTQRKMALAILDSLGVSALQKRNVGAVSYGQARKLLIGRALVHDPAILVLDEPTAGLDLPSSEDFLQTLDALAAKGRSLIIVTHHLHEISPAVTHVAFLDGGKITGDGIKSRMLNEKLLSKLFGFPLNVRRVGRRYWAFPNPALARAFY